MRPSVRCARLLAAGVLAFAAPAGWIASAQTAAPPASGAVGAEAVAQCERAVRQALAQKAGPAADLRFSAAPAVRVPSGEGPVVLHGDGQWRDATVVRKFSYSCNLDPHGGEALGVVIRQAAAPAAPQPVAEPDLSHVSPSACESSAAAALKQRWPRVSQISFDTATRSLTPQSSSRAELRGQGRAQPAPESPLLVHFGFDCTIDPRDGRVLGLRLGV